MSTATLLDNPVALRAYLAGLIDGEGYIGARRRLPSAANKMTSPRYTITVSVAMTDEEPVRLVAQAADADHLVYVRHRGEYKPIWIIDLERISAVELLEKIVPYLVGKKTQAETAIEFGKLLQTSREHRTKVISTHVFQGGRNAGKAYRTFGLSDEFIAECDAYYTKLLRLSPRSGQGSKFTGSED